MTINEEAKALNAAFNKAISKNKTFDIVAWKKLREKNSGLNAPNYGKKLTNEQKEHLSKIGYERYKNGFDYKEETKDKISLSLKKYYKKITGMIINQILRASASSLFDRKSQIVAPGQITNFQNSFRDKRVKKTKMLNLFMCF